MHNYGFKIFWSDTDEAFIATCPEFPGLSAFGETRDEALREAQVALELFVEDLKESGEQLPAPRLAHTYSGQFRVRLTRTLHRQLAERAEQEGVSLNALVMTYLSAGKDANTTKTSTARKSSSSKKLAAKTKRQSPGTKQNKAESAAF